ncbi:MAG TPA: DUF3341 domain-containing protein [Lichenihabitans sp.]|nr:DUF3341 domain-containing protein [Lichenihabitans sp.]
MTRPRLATFVDADALVAAVDLMRREGFAVADALTPFPVPELTRRLDASSRVMRPAMALFGFGTALLFVALQVYSQAYAYPLNSGGRPLASWAVYYLVPFETGVLAAAMAGFAVLLWRCGLPRLHHPLFAVPGIERATQDRFILIVDGPADEDAARRLGDALFGAGALSVGEVET